MGRRWRCRWRDEECRVMSSGAGVGVGGRMGGT